MGGTSCGTRRRGAARRAALPFPGARERSSTMKASGTVSGAGGVGSGPGPPRRVERGHGSAPCGAGQHGGGTASARRVAKARGPELPAQRGVAWLRSGRYVVPMSRGLPGRRRDGAVPAAPGGKQAGSAAAPGLILSVLTRASCFSAERVQSHRALPSYPEMSNPTAVSDADLRSQSRCCQVPLLVLRVSAEEDEEVFWGDRVLRAGMD